MKQFGVDEIGNRDSFKIICCNCGKEAHMTPTHHYTNIAERELDKITLDFRCSCGNHFITTIHK